MTQSLLELYNQNPARYLDTDKENPNHHYISKLYSDEFQKYLNRDINLLEIGLGSGGSLLLWNDYFTNAKIYAIDSGTDPRFNICIDVVKDCANINLIKSDAYLPGLTDMLPNFDIIIDDGPHTKDSHLKCLDLYLPKLNPGGILIIEDIDDIEWIEDYKAKIPEGFTHSTIDTDRSLEYNNLLFLVKKI